MTNIEKLLEFLRHNPNLSYCDDCLQQKTGINRRQQVNRICHYLVDRGMILREKGLCSLCGKQKLINQIHGSDPNGSEKQNRVTQNPVLETEGMTWYWEGNLQSKLVSWLVGEGYKILSVADTARRSRGVDIIAQHAQGETLWITVKGYPKTHRHEQARHYFAEAIFDLVLYRGESDSVKLGVGLPAGFATYANLARKVQWMRKEILPFDIYWISEDGQVQKE